MMSNLEDSVKRELAAKASVDPRTLIKALAGEPVRGLAGQRARAVLIEAGLLDTAAQPGQSAGLG